MNFTEPPLPPPPFVNSRASHLASHRTESSANKSTRAAAVCKQKGGEVLEMILSVVRGRPVACPHNKSRHQSICPILNGCKHWQEVKAGQFHSTEEPVQRSRRWIWFSIRNKVHPILYSSPAPLSSCLPHPSVHELFWSVFIVAETEAFVRSLINVYEQKIHSFAYDGLLWNNLFNLHVLEGIWGSNVNFLLIFWVYKYSWMKEPLSNCS